MTENRETDGSGARNPALDAVRAAAALVVVIGHALTVAGLCEGPSASAMAQFVVAAGQPGLTNSWVNWMSRMRMARATVSIKSSGSAKRLTSGLVFSESVKAMILSIREPEGVGPAPVIEAAIDH